MRQPSLILASGSPRRRELLGKAELCFDVIPSRAQEIQPSHLSPAEMCQANALIKAMDVARQHPDRWVLGADTLVFLDDKPLGKPADMTEAHQMLKSLQNREHWVITGVCLIRGGTDEVDIFAELSQVWFHPLSDAKIRTYHAAVCPLDKAGAYGIQEHGSMIVRGLRGSFSNIMGLPVERLQSRWRKLPDWHEFFSQPLRRENGRRIRQR